MDIKFALGSKVKDKVLDLEYTVTGACVFLHGMTRYCIERVQDGKGVSVWEYEDRFEAVG